MMNTRFSLLSLLALLVILASLSACGGGSAGLVDNGFEPADTFTGVDDGDFKAVRYNDAGYADTALNSTLEISTASTDTETVVTISLKDTDPMWSGNVDLVYDPDRFNPVAAEFGNNVDTELEMAVLNIAGTVSAAQVSTEGPVARDGELVTVRFTNEPTKNVTKVAAATHAADALDSYVYEPDSLTAGTGAAAFEVDTDVDPPAYTIRSVFAMSDSSNDGLTSLADLTPVAQQFNGAVSDSDYTAGYADHNADGVVSLADITPIAQNFNAETTGIDMWLLDSDTFDDGATPWMSLGWSDANAWASPDAGSTDWNEVFLNWTGEIPAVDITAADVNSDGDVWLFARAFNDTETGTVSSGVNLGAGVTPPGDVIITDFRGMIDGADDGSGGNLFVDGDTASAPANSELTFTLDAIAGTYDGTPFTFDDHAAVPAADYDAALLAVEDNADIVVTAAGDPGMNQTAPVIALDDTGDDLIGTVFPDDQMDTMTTPEGLITITIPEAYTNQPAGAGDLVAEIDFDVTADAAAPVLSDFSTPDGMGAENWIINIDQPTPLGATVDFMGNDPADTQLVTVELYDITNGEMAMTFLPVIDDMGPNEFRLSDNGDGTFQLDAIIGSYMVEADTVYGLRLQDAGAPWSSINKPFEYFEAEGITPPDDQALMIMPADQDLNANVDSLWIFYPDPQIRRNPHLEFDSFSQAWEPIDVDAYSDKVKATGDEFLLALDNGRFPQVVVVEGTDPMAITGVDDPNKIDLVLQSQYSPSYLALDISSITQDSGMGDPVDYAFAAFLPDNQRVGYGTFSVEPMAMAPLSPTGVDWGIDIFDDAGRGDLDLASRDFTMKQLDANTVGTAEPDVLWVEVNAGCEVYNWYNPGQPNPNIQILVDGGPVSNFELEWDARAVVDTGTEIHYLLMHVFTENDFTKQGDPLWPGLLNPGQPDLGIVVAEPGGANPSPLTGTFTIVGNNPNNP